MSIIKRTLSNNQLPALTQAPQSELPTAIPLDTPVEQIQFNPVVNNRAATNSPMELVGEVNQAPIQPSEHSSPEKSNRSNSASSAGTSATTNDEITALTKAAEQGDAEAQFSTFVEALKLNTNLTLLELPNLTMLKNTRLCDLLAFLLRW